MGRTYHNTRWSEGSRSGWEFLRDGAHFCGLLYDGTQQWATRREAGTSSVSPRIPHRQKNLVTVAEYAKFIQVKGPVGPNGEMYLDVEDPDTLIHRRGEQDRDLP